MVDMYSDAGVLQNVVSAGQDPLEVCAFFDQSGLVADVRTRFARAETPVEVGGITPLE